MNNVATIQSQCFPDCGIMTMFVLSPPITVNVKSMHIKLPVNKPFPPSVAATRCNVADAKSHIFILGLYIEVCHKSTIIKTNQKI